MSARRHFLCLREDKPKNRSEDRPLHKKERAGHDVSCPYEDGTKPKTHPCRNRTRKDGPPTNSTDARQRDSPISFFEFRVSGDVARHSTLATAVICYAMQRSTPLPRARPGKGLP